MLSQEERAIIERTAIRGRIALGLTCIERCLEHERVVNTSMGDALTVYWRFVEVFDMADTDTALHYMPVGDALYAAEKDLPLPPEFDNIPRYIMVALTYVDEIAIGDMYGAVSGTSPTTLAATESVLDTCREHGVAVPHLEQFARLPFTAKDPYGKPVPRSFFTAPLTNGSG